MNPSSVLVLHLNLSIILEVSDYEVEVKWHVALFRIFIQKFKWDINASIWI